MAILLLSLLHDCLVSVTTVAETVMIVTIVVVTEMTVNAGILPKRLFFIEFLFPICLVTLLGRYVPYVLAWVAFQLDICYFHLLLESKDYPGV